MIIFFFFFFSSRRRHTRFKCDWSSDVCSSDLVPLLGSALLRAAREQYRRRGFPGADAIDATTLRLHLRAIAATDFRLLRQAVKSPLPPTLVAYAHDDHMVERWISEQLVAALSGPRVLAFSDG